MSTGFKKFGAAFVVGALYLSSYTPVAHGENFLGGLAAITAVSSPIVATAIQAGAQKSIAQINSGASIYMSTLAAQTSAAAIGASVYTAALNGLTTLRIASMNNQLSLEQSYISMAAQSRFRELDYQLKREQMLSDNYFKMKELELRETLQRAELAQNQARFQAELVSKGLASGLQPVRTLAGLAVNPIESTSARPNLSWMDPRQWAAPKNLQFNTGILGRAFSQTSGLASGSSRIQKRRGDIARFLAQTLNKPSLPLHQSGRGIRVGESTHSTGDVRVFIRPEASENP